MPSAAYSSANQPEPEPADRSTVRQHVERGDGVGEHGRMAQERRRDEHAEPDPLGDAGQPGERRVRLRQVLPRRTDLRDLAQVIHHPNVLDSGRLGLGDDPPEVLGEACRTARPLEARQLQADPDPGVGRRVDGGPDVAGASPSLSDRDRCDDRAGTSAAGTSATGSGVTMSCQGSARDVGPDVGPPAQLVGDDVGTHRDLAGAVAATALRGGRVEHDRDARHDRRPPPAHATAGVGRRRGRACR